MPTYEYSDLLIVDTSSSLPSSARRGQYAHTKDTNKLYFYSGSAWTLLGGGATGVGDVTGPSSAVNENIALFSGTTGKAIKDGLTSIGDLKNASNINAGTLALARGGTGASLVDPNADRILFWDDSAGAVDWLTAGSGLSLSGTTITASGGSSSFSGSRVYNSTGTTIGTNYSAYTLLTFDSEDFDTDSYHSTSSNTSRLVVGSDGYYLVQSAVYFTGGTTTQSVTNVRKNAGGSSASGTGLDLRIMTNTGAPTSVQSSAVFFLSSSDYVELFAVKTGSGTTTADVGSERTFFSITKIGT